MNPASIIHRRWLDDFVGLLVPRLCPGCDKALLTFEDIMCLECLGDLPRTRFHHDARNKVEQLFWGKAQLCAASSFLQFSRSGKVQGMLHQLKYRRGREVGILLGRLMAEELRHEPRFQDVDAYLPVPLHPRRERKRGYNQSRVLAEGMADVWPKPILGQELLRVVRTSSQTRRGRLERWMNVKEAFQLPDPDALRGMHVLIIDDVVTTGSTVEGCIKALGQVPGLRASLFTAACA